MDARSFVHLLSYLEPVFCAFVLTALIRSGSLRKFPSLAALLGVRLASSMICIGVVNLTGIERAFVTGGAGKGENDDEGANKILHESGLQGNLKFLNIRFENV